MARHYDLARREKIRDLYLSGLSIRKVSELTNFSKSYIDYICADIRRSKREANIGKVRKHSIHWRTMRQRARRKISLVLGRELETWEHVHHVDGDYTNNDISNLQVLSNTEHISNHNRGKYYGTPRHTWPYRIAYQKEYQKHYREQQKHVATS